MRPARVSAGVNRCKVVRFEHQGRSDHFQRAADDAGGAVCVLLENVAVFAGIEDTGADDLDDKLFFHGVFLSSGARRAVVVSMSVLYHR